MASQHLASSGGACDEYAHTAQFYDLLYQQGAPRDIPFYLELAARQAGPVLELGCGTGRVTLPLAQAGHTVTGLDLSPAMLAQCQAKLAVAESAVRQRVKLVQGSMSSFTLEQRFALVLAPYRAFQHLLTVEEQQVCLGRIRAHLADGGVYLHNVFNPSLAYIMDHVRRGKVWECDLEAADPASERYLRRSHMLEYDLATQVLRVDWKFEEYNHAGVLLSTTLETMHLRWQYRFEAEHLLSLCGFEILETYGGYDRQPLTDLAGELIYLCR
jgi:SAM-dependent methyltransferase